MEATFEMAVTHATERRNSAERAFTEQSGCTEIAQEISLREAAIEAQVAGEMDGDKPAYSNVDKRKAEAAIRCAIDPELIALHKAHEISRQAAANASIDATFHHDMHRACCAFARGGDA